jgi:hypothetical protein
MIRRDSQGNGIEQRKLMSGRASTVKHTHDLRQVPGNLLNHVDESLVGT